MQYYNLISYIQNILQLFVVKKTSLIEFVKIFVITINRGSGKILI